MKIQPLDFVEVKRLAQQIAESPQKKVTIAELLGEVDSEKRKGLNPVFVKAVLKTARKIIREESQPHLYKIQDWGFAQIIRNIQGRIETPSQESLDSADAELERALGQMSCEDYLNVCNSAQNLLLMYEHALPTEIKGERKYKNQISEGTKEYFYKKLQKQYDEISYLELDTNAIATKSSLAILMLTKNEEFMPESLYIRDLKLENINDIVSKLNYGQKRDLFLALFMNPGTSAEELNPFMKSLFTIASSSNKEISVETEANHTDQDNLLLDTVRYCLNGKLIEDEIDWGPNTNDSSVESQKQDLNSLAIEINNINQYIGNLLYTQAIISPSEIDTPIDFNEDEDNEWGGVGLVDNNGMTPFVAHSYTKQYLLHRQEILIQGMEEYIFDISFEDKLKLFPSLDGDEHRLRLACILANDAESDLDVAKAEALFLNEITDETLLDKHGYRASKGVEYYANLKKEDSVDKLIEFLDHKDHLVRYEAFKKLCDEDSTGIPGVNALIEKIKKDITFKTPSWALAAICKYSSSEYSSEVGNQDKYRAVLIAILTLKDIDIKDAFKRLDGLEVPFTLNLGEPTPGQIESLSLLEAIDYIGIPELVDITLHAPETTTRKNAMEILMVLLEEDPSALDNFMKTHELADCLRQGADISRASKKKLS